MRTLREPIESVVEGWETNFEEILLFTNAVERCNFEEILLFTNAVERYNFEEILMLGDEIFCLPTQYDYLRVYNIMH